MSQSHGGDSIAWRDWSEEAFAASRSEDKPVLLTLGATWCHWCHVMDETAYSDPRVIELANSRFIPVRVDVDQRPDISLRYNQGTYPSVAVLTADGELVAGRPYTPADEMAALLEQISSGEFVDEKPRSGTPSGSPADQASQASVDTVQVRPQELYDEEFGGFGLEPKQPPWEALDFLVARYGLTGDRALLGMVETTLEGMWHGIYDRKDQGFFRYAVSRDWKVPHYEKMLVTNANLAMAYLEAFRIARKAIYRTATDGILEYLVTTLFSPDDGLFHASQDADEPFYQGSWKDRDQGTAPPVDRTLYAGWNALAALALVQAGGRSEPRVPPAFGGRHPGHPVDRELDIRQRPQPPHGRGKPRRACPHRPGVFPPGLAGQVPVDGSARAPEPGGRSRRDDAAAVRRRSRRLLRHDPTQLIRSRIPAP